jgi:glycerol uptake facilitator-like aquaporin
MMPIAKRAAAEFLGTFWLVFGGCGSAVLAAAFPQLGIGFAGVALAFGLTVLTMALGGIVYTWLDMQKPEITGDARA